MPFQSAGRLGKKSQARPAWSGYHRRKSGWGLRDIASANLGAPLERATIANTDGAGARPRTDTA